MLSRLQKWLTTKIPLRFLIIAFFVIQSSLVTFIVGFLIIYNGRVNADRVMDRFGSEIATHIEQQIYNFLTTPQTINKTNATLIQQGRLDVHDAEAMEDYFAEQIRQFNTVSSIYFGNTDGGLVDAGREGAGGQRYVLATDQFVSGPLRKYILDDEANRIRLVTTIPNFDARERSWYINAVEEAQATWNDVYILFTGDDMAIAASRPVYDDQQNLLGVVSTDIFVSHLGKFLQTLDMGRNGVSFIMDRSGLLVASSTGENPFTNLEEGKYPQHLLASESAIPAVRYAANALTAQFGDYQQITSAQQLEFQIDGQSQFLEVLPIQDKYGVDWLLVVMLPVAQFTPELKTFLRTTAISILVTLILTVLLGILAAQWITRPVLRLNASTQAVAKGDWDQTVSPEWIREIDNLGKSFNRMVEQLKQTLESLSVEIAERMQVEETLRESEAQYRSLIEHSSDAIYLLYENRFEIINLRFTELFGVTAEEACSPDFDFMNLVAPESRPLIQERTTKRQQGEELNSYYTFTAQGKAGNEIEIEASVSYVPYKHSTATQGILRDITERVRTEGMLRQSNQRLGEALAELRETQEQMMHQERLAAVGRLVAGIAHDFNNLLATITIYSQMALEMDYPPPPPEIRRRLETIASQTSQGTALVQQIMDFGRKSLIRRTVFALDMLLEDMVELLSHTLPANIRLNLTFEPGEYIIEADRTRVQQAIMNLALNARDVMPKGGDIHIALSRVQTLPFSCKDCGLVEEGEWLLVEVRDSGSGIPDHVLPHLFEPFFTTRAPLGHGLGLAQVYGIVKQHNGHVNVETEAGQGSTFRLYWPALPVPEPESRLAETI